MSFLGCNASLVCLRFESNEEAPAEPAPGEGGEGNNSAGSCQVSAEMKGEDLLSVCAVMTAAALFCLQFGFRDFTNLLEICSWCNTSSKTHIHSLIRLI